MQVESIVNAKTVQPSIKHTAADDNYNWRVMLINALVITRREITDSFRDWRILAPILILTFVFPFLATFVANEFLGFVLSYGSELRLIADRTIPFMLMIVGFFPISISLVIALETFVGEKERRSLEPLLSTPLTNTELYIGKTLAAMIPPLVASYGGMLVYLSRLVFGEVAWQPEPVLIIQIFLITTMQALVMVTGSVVVSSQATSTRAANLLASFIIIPMTLIIQGESFIMFIAPDADSPYGIKALWLIILAMAVVVVLFLRVGNSIFNREELLGRAIDEINLRTTAKRMWQHIRAVNVDITPAKNIIHWYSAGIPMAIGRAKVALWITVIWFTIALIGGLYVGQMDAYQLNLPGELTTLEQSDSFRLMVDTSVQRRAVGFVFMNNLRVLLLALVLGIFSLGAMSLIVTPAVFVLIGYIFTQFVAAGLDPNIFFASILPHGIFEIPAVILATAAAFRLGSVITKPPQGQTVGSAWMTAFGDTAKIWLGVVLPLLILAALTEAFITPQVLQMVLR